MGEGWEVVILIFSNLNLNQYFSRWDDFAPRGHLAIPRHVSMVTIEGRVLLASSGQ